MLCLKGRLRFAGMTAWIWRGPEYLYRRVSGAVAQKKGLQYLAALQPREKTNRAVEGLGDSSRSFSSVHRCMGRLQNPANAIEHGGGLRQEKAASLKGDCGRRNQMSQVAAAS